MRPGDHPADDDLALPPLWRATLDEPALALLFRDLGCDAEVRSVQIKGAAERMAPEEMHTLESAWTLLTRREVRGVQIRYRFENEEWTDTLLRLDEGYRLVRMRACHQE